MRPFSFEIMCESALDSPPKLDVLIDLLTLNVSLSVWQVSNRPACSRYRLAILSLRNSAAANSVQLDTLLLYGNLRGDAPRQPTDGAEPQVSHPSSKVAFAKAVREEFMGLIATGDYKGREAVAAARAVVVVTKRSSAVH